MNPEQLDPSAVPNPEQEAMVKLQMDGNQVRENVEANTAASAVKLNEIEQNQEAQLVQSMKSTKEMIETIAPSLQAQERMANIFSSLMTNLEGPPGEDGKTPVKGKDYFTDQEIADFLNKATPVKGKDYYTAEEVAQLKREITPVKDRDYRDGEDGVDGRNPMTVSAQKPLDPQVGDLWYQP